jgi:hypothetical protein
LNLPLRQQYINAENSQVLSLFSAEVDKSVDMGASPLPQAVLDARTHGERDLEPY